VSIRAAGRVPVELPDAAEQPRPGFTLADGDGFHGDGFHGDDFHGDDFHGDDVHRRVPWRDQADLSRLRGQRPSGGWSSAMPMSTRIGSPSTRAGPASTTADRAETAPHSSRRLA
jgi:hypothetical protein